MNTWIFQGNPKIFDIDKYFLKKQKQKNDNILWSVRQKHFINKILLGDEVYIWRSDGGKTGSGGIIAKGEILSLPKKMLDDAPELWISKPKDMMALRVSIKIKDIRLNASQGMLSRERLKYDPEINKIRILHYYSQTNYLLTIEQSKYLSMLWN